MSFNYTILNETDFRTRVVKYYESILNGRLLNFDARTASDDEVISFLVDYDVNASSYDNCFSWLEIGDVETKSYYDTDYQVVNLKSAGVNALQIKFSAFKYRNPLYKISEFSDCFVSYHSAYHSTNVDELYVSTIDGHEVSPEIFFAENKGRKFLFLASFVTINKYNKTQQCYEFLFKNVSPEDIRRNIMRFQIAYLQWILAHPVEAGPEAKIKIESAGGHSLPASGPVRGGIVLDFQNDVFEKEFRHKFIEKLTRLRNGVCWLSSAR